MKRISLIWSMTIISSFFIHGCGAVASSESTLTATAQATTLAPSPLPPLATSLPDSHAQELSDNPAYAFQVGNASPLLTFEPLKSEDLENNHMGDMVSLYPSAHPDHPGFETPDQFAERINEKGLKWMRLSLDWYDWNEIETNGAYSQLSIDPLQLETMDSLLGKDISILYTLVYWDDQIQASEGYTRFKSEPEIQRYLDYVRFVVSSLKGRVEYYSILNEPNIGLGTQQYVETIDYINLAKRTIPVIRQEDPEAKILVGEVTPLIWPNSIAYLFEILESDLPPLADGLVWHAAGWASPEYMAEEYYRYHDLLVEIMQTAGKIGLQGEFWATEMHWRTAESSHPNEYDGYTGEVAAKYLARGVIMHRGLGITAGLAENLEHPDKMPVIQNLCTLLAGVEPTELIVEIESHAEHVRSFSFMNLQEELLVALYSDGIAMEGSLGIPSTIVIRDTNASKIFGIDPLTGNMQELTFNLEGDSIILPDLFVKDYPIFLRISDASP
jgi:hypothetical protein